MRILYHFCIVIVLAITVFLTEVKGDDEVKPIKIVNNRGKQKDLVTQSLDIEVSHMGYYAETVYTFTFKNLGKRDTEGEFVFPIPEGAHLSQLWLEVGGKLRRSTSVRKEQAKNAYETLTRRNIDPALVEKLDDRNFRTRLFPIPSDGTKQIRIAYLEKLKKEEGNLIHRLPVHLLGKCGKFNLTVNKDPGRSVEASINDKVKNEVFLKNVKLKQEFIISTIAPTKPLLYQVEDKHHFFKSIQFPNKAFDREPKRVKSFKNVNIMWDTSISMRSLEKEKVLNKLDEFLTKERCVSARLIPFGSDLSGESFKGSWRQVKDKISKLEYVGGVLKREVLNESLGGHPTIIITDSVRSIPEIAEDKNLKLFLISLLNEDNPQLITKLTQRFQLKYIPATYFLESPELLKHLAVIVSNSKDRSQDTNTDLSDQFLLFSSYGNDTGSELKVNHKNIQIEGNTVNCSMAERVWAWNQQTKLEIIGTVEEQIKHATQYNVISDHTSFIVLDRLEDYIDYNITPPKNSSIYDKWVERVRESEEYNMAISKIQDTHFSNWKKTDYDWIDKLVRDEYFNTKTWLKSLPQVFSKEQLARIEVDKHKLWVAETSEILLARPKPGEPNQEWSEQIDRALLKRQQILKEKVAVKQNPAVSVRGNVIRHRTYQFKGLTNLKEALNAAEVSGGGIYAGYSPIALYRNGSKYYFNPSVSDSYSHILEHGDMIVLEKKINLHYSFFNITKSGSPGNSYQELLSPDLLSPFFSNFEDDSGGLFSESRSESTVATKPSVSRPYGVKKNTVSFDYSVLTNEKKLKELGVAKGASVKETLLKIAPVYENSPDFHIYLAQHLNIESDKELMIASLLNAIDLSKRSVASLVKIAKTAAVHEKDLELMKIAQSLLYELVKQYPNNSQLLWEASKVSNPKEIIKYRDSADSEAVKSIIYQNSNNLHASVGFKVDRDYFRESYSNYAKFKFGGVTGIANEKIKKVEADIFIELDSHSASRNVSFAVKTPTGNHASYLSVSYPNNYGEVFIFPKRQPGFVQGMYCNKLAIPGEYEVTLFHEFHEKEERNPFPIYLSITKNLNRDNQTVEKVKLWIDPNKSTQTVMKPFIWDSNKTAK